MTRTTTAEISWCVLRNHEGRFSLIPQHHPVPSGWQVQQPAASREECLADIATIWTDMRPDSLKNEVS